MKFISLLSIVFLLASLISSSGAQPHAHMGKWNLNNNIDNDNWKCVAECTHDLKRGFNSKSKAVCAKAKDVGLGMEPYRACLGGKDNAFTQVCAAACATTDANAKALLIKSDAEACKNVNMGLREKYFWCKRGYNESWEKLSSVVSGIIEKESEEAEESIKDLIDTNQQSDISQAQALLKEVDHAKEEQLKRKVEESANDESVKVKDPADTIQDSIISQAQTRVLAKEVDQAKEQQVKSKVYFEILGQNTDSDLGSTFQGQELNVGLVHSHVRETTQSEEVSSGTKNSLELQGVAEAEAVTITCLEYFTGNKAGTSNRTSRCTVFYVPGRCTHDIGSESYRDTALQPQLQLQLQLQTHTDMDEVDVNLVGETKHGDCAWNIVSSYFTCIRAETVDYMWHYRHKLFANCDGGGGKGRGAIIWIWTAWSGDVFQFFDTGPSSHAPSSKSLKWEGHWHWKIRVCLEDLLLFESSLDSQKSVDELNPWQHLSTMQQVEQQHMLITEQLGRPLHDWLVKSRHMPMPVPFAFLSLSSKAPNIREPGLDLDEGEGESELFHSGRFDCMFAPFSSYEVLRLYISVPMLSDHVVFDADSISPSTMASIYHTGGNDYYLADVPDIGYPCFAVALFLLALQCYYFPVARRILEIETPTAATATAIADHVVILDAFREIMIKWNWKWKFWWRHLIDINWIIGSKSKIPPNKSLRSKSKFELGIVRLHPELGFHWAQIGRRGTGRRSWQLRLRLRLGLGRHWKSPN